jgi:hypothetical protein
VIESGEYNDMQSLLEERDRDIARLQRQVEDLKSSLEAILPPVAHRRASKLRRSSRGGRRNPLPHR